MMTNVQQNIVTALQIVDTDLIQIKNRLNSLIGMYTNEGIADLTDADFAPYPPFAHITQAEFLAANLGLAAINTALGEFSSATSVVSKLLKVVPAVPR